MWTQSGQNSYDNYRPALQVRSIIGKGQTKVSLFVQSSIHSANRPTNQANKQTDRKWMPSISFSYFIKISAFVGEAIRVASSIWTIQIVIWYLSSCHISEIPLVSEQHFALGNRLLADKKRNWNYGWKCYEYGTQMGGKYLLVSSECKYCNGQSPCWLQIVLQAYKANKVFRVAQSNWKQTITFPVYLLSANN